MGSTGFKLNHWKLVAIFSMIYIIVDVVMYVRNRIQRKEPILSKDFFNTILGGN